VRKAGELDGPTFCVVAPDIPPSVVEDIRAACDEAGVEDVIVDRRRHERRREGERRRASSPSPSGSRGAGERRVIRSAAGRRVADRRAHEHATDAPCILPTSARPHSARVRFLRRRGASPQEMEDRETARLVIRLQAGDEGAFDELYESHIDRIYGYLRVALGDAYEAEDAAQEVFIRVLEALPRFVMRDVPFRVWLFRIVRNYTINHIERQRRLDLAEPVEINRRLERRGQTVAAQTLEQLGDTDLLRLIERLPIVQRQVIVLRFVLDFTVAEVAEILGRSPGAVSQLQRRGFSIIRSRVGAIDRVPARRDARLAMRGRLREAIVLRTRQLALLR
jgi:RNA polymerase sigma-70 factor, ECF subfamily